MFSNNDAMFFLSGLFIGSTFEKLLSTENPTRESAKTYETLHSDTVKLQNQEFKNPYMILMIYDSIIGFPCCPTITFDNLLQSPKLLRMHIDVLYFMFPIYPYEKGDSIIPSQIFLTSDIRKFISSSSSHLTKFFKGLRIFFDDVKLYIVEFDRTKIKWAHEEIVDFQLEQFKRVIVSCLCFSFNFLVMALLGLLEKTFSPNDLKEIKWIIENRVDYTIRKKSITIPAFIENRSYDFSGMDLSMNLIIEGIVLQELVSQGTKIKKPQFYEYLFLQEQ